MVTQVVPFAGVIFKICVTSSAGAHEIEYTACGGGGLGGGRRRRGGGTDVLRCAPAQIRIEVRRYRTLVEGFYVGTVVLGAEIVSCAGQIVWVFESSALCAAKVDRRNAAGARRGGRVDIAYVGIGAGRQRRVELLRGATADRGGDVGAVGEYRAHVIILTSGVGGVGVRSNADARVVGSCGSDRRQALLKMQKDRRRTEVESNRLTANRRYFAISC